MSSTELEHPMDVTGFAPDLPQISVVIPTWNRAGVLPFLFQALARQLYPSDRIEAIVVDNSSDDDTESVVASWARAVPFELRYFRKENRGPAVSRNYGAARAKGEIIAFTDSDCIPDPHWLRNAIVGFRSGYGIVCGPFLPVLRAGDDLISAQQAPLTADRGCYPTANLLVKKDAFDRVGGFDEQFGLYRWGELVAGEDTDMAWRVKRSGEESLFAPGVVVWHLATPIPLWKFLLRPVVVQIIPRLIPTIPELRQTYLWRRYFLSKLHFEFLLLLVGMVAASVTRNPVPLLLTAPWTWFAVRHFIIPSARHEGIPKALLRLGLICYLEIATTVVLAQASIRFRRLVI